MSRLARYFRLLPAVVVVGTGLLAVKSVDIARAAQAAAETVDPDQPDNSGLAPTDNGGKPATDYANDGATLASPAEVDVVSSLTRRRAELDARERALNMRENVLGAGEARVDQKIAALKDLQTQIQALLAQRDAKQDAQIAALVKTYAAMKPKDAARIFNSLSDDVLVPVAKGMKSDVLAPVMAAMNPDAAQKLTVKLAALLKLPDSSPGAICPAPAADASTPAPVASTTPLQTAALTPPPVVTPIPTPTPPPAQPVATTAPPAVTPTAAAVPTPRKPAPHRAPSKPAPAKPLAAATPAVKPVTPAPSPAAASAAPPPSATPQTTAPAAASGPPA
jgi:flagellar motility protein MotE (MotC chaperone)